MLVLKNVSDKLASVCYDFLKSTQIYILQNDDIYIYICLLLIIIVTYLNINK
jgi:hypothetical protein